MDWKAQKFDKNGKRTGNGRGRPKAIESPEALWNLACDYFASVDSKPIKINEVLKGGMKAGTIVKVDTARPYTWKAFSAFLFSRGVISDIDDYKANLKGNYSEFSDIITHIDNIIYSQKFEGASVGIFHHAIIARDLGLTDKSETTIKEQPLFPEEPEEE
jgi:hypothetical protein